jgi:hypothetical protein
MQYVKNRIRKHPNLTDEEVLEMYPHATQEMIDNYRGDLKNESSRKSLFGSTKINK